METRSAVLVGLLGAVKLVPLVAMSLVGGAVADRSDRRRLLLLTQIGVVTGAGGLAVAAFLGDPSLVTLYAAGRLLAGFTALQNTARSAIVPDLVNDRAMLPPAVVMNYGLETLSTVIGPGLGGILIAAFGVRAAYTIDACSCLAVVLTVLPIAPQPAAALRDDPTQTCGARSPRGCATYAATGRSSVRSLSTSWR